MATTAKTKLPKTDKTPKSARKSAQVLKAKAPTKTTAKTTARTTSKTAAKTAAATFNKEEVVAKIETLKGDLANLTATLKENGVNYVDAKTADVRATAAETAGLAKDKAVETAELAKDKYAELAADTEAKIRANPLTAVAIAAGVGLFFGALSRR